MSAPVAAVVVASRGGARLARALASVAWASERLVVDPAGRLGAEVLPAGVGRARGEPADAASAPWLLLLEEHEVVPPSLATAVAEVAGVAGALAGYRIGQEAQAFGATFRLPGAPVRLARRPGARLRLGAGLAAEIRPASGRIGRLRERIVGAGADSLAAALDDLDADAAMLAALLRRKGVRPTLGRLALAPVLPAVRALAARGPLRGFWVRWTLAVLGGYRALVAHTKLWEMRRTEGARLG